MDSKKPESVAQVAPYEGNKDFIFISYSHRDTATVLPLLHRMKEEGYRFWYDEGIDPVSEWSESVAAHLSRCRVCLAFISPTSLASRNCRREINFALFKNKEFLSVILEPVEMSPAVEMQSSTCQFILKYKYRQEEQFLNRLLNLELLKSCREPRKKKSVAAPTLPVQPTAAGHPPRPPFQTEKARRSKSNTVSTAWLKKWIPFAAMGAAILLVVIIAAFAIGGNSGAAGVNPGGSSTGKLDPSGTGAGELDPGKIPSRGIVTIGDAVYRDNVTIQRVTGAALSTEQLQALATFEKCSQLHLENCTLESGALDALSSMEQLNALSLENCRGMGDLSFLNDLPKLDALNITNSGLTDEQLAGFRGEHVTTLRLNGNALSKVPELADPARVTELSLAGNPLAGLAGLSAWTGMTSLNVSGCGLTSLEGIEGLQSIKTLHAADNQISDLTPLTKLIYLSTLDLKNSGVTSLAPLRYCQQLSVVSLRGNPDCSDLEVLSGSAGTLTHLDISGLHTPDDSLAFLSGSKKLTRLYAEDCGLVDCSGLEDCAALTTVSLAGNRISDISGLKDLAAVKYLNLADNEIDALPDLGRLGADVNYPVYVFSNNRLINMKNLPLLHYYGLMVNGNPLNDLSALGAGAEGTNLIFDCTELTPLEPLTETGFLAIYATSVFVGKQAELEGNYRYRCVLTAGEAFEQVAGSNFVPGF